MLMKTIGGSKLTPKCSKNINLNHNNNKYFTLKMFKVDVETNINKNK